MVHVESLPYQKSRVWKVKPSRCKKSSCTSELVSTTRAKSSADLSLQVFDRALQSGSKLVDYSYHASFSRKPNNDYFISRIRVCVVPRFRRVSRCDARNRGEARAPATTIVRCSASFCAHGRYRGRAGAE